ncbi:MAG: hypothetical protein WCJ56_11090 [bacterium]
MNYRLNIVIFTLLLLPLAVRADGLAYGKGFTQQLQETHQLAVINLDETTADVSMFIAIEGIPAGEELTYILPFWYKPVDFTMTEEDAKTFRETRVAPANEKVVRMKRLTGHEGSIKLIEAAGIIVGGYISTIVFPTFSKNGAALKPSGGITGLIPYSTSETAHARAELFEIGDKDLQQLIQQSGLPEEYVKPLQKYKTPYFAVMHLKGLSVDESQQKEMSGKGVRYHFTHQLTGGKYIYPLGTGAAWPQPIPFTEVYITCPENQVMQVTAPTEGERLYWSHFSGRAKEFAIYSTFSPEEKAKSMSDKYDSHDYLTPATSSLLGTDVKRTFAWNIAYMQSNPSEDISVQLSKQSPIALLRLRIADFFAASGNAILICLLLSLISWLITARLVIRRQWLRQGSPGKLLWYTLKTYLFAALYIPLISIVIICIVLLATLAATNTIALSALIMMMLMVLLWAIMQYIKSRSAEAPKKSDNWRDWPIFTPWLSATSIFLLQVVLLTMFVSWCESV